MASGVVEPPPSLGPLCDNCRWLIDDFSASSQEFSITKTRKWKSSAREGCIVCVSLLDDASMPWNSPDNPKSKELREDIEAQYQVRLFKQSSDRGIGRNSFLAFTLSDMKEYTNIAWVDARRVEHGKFTLMAITIC